MHPIETARLVGTIALSRIALVGNAPSFVDHSSSIDKADRVVRFNNAFGYGGVTGRKINDLFLINCGGQMFEWLQDGTLWERDYVRLTPQITLPIKADRAQSNLTHYRMANLEERHGINFEYDVRPIGKRLGKKVVTLDKGLFRSAVNALRRHGCRRERVTPSTGFLAIYAYASRAEQLSFVELYGFGFAGWEGHSWEAERSWVSEQEKLGRVRCL